MKHHRISGPILTDNYWEGSYENMMDEVFLLYHQYPTNLIHFNLSAGEQARMSEYDAYSRVGGENSAPPAGWKAKKVFFQRDENFVNGIPRKR